MSAQTWEGEAENPAHCKFCGVHRSLVREAGEYCCEQQGREMTDIDKLTDLLEGITPLPWAINKDKALLDSNGYFLPLGDAEITAIVAVMNAAPELIARVQRAEGYGTLNIPAMLEERDQLRERVRELEAENWELETENRELETEKDAEYERLRAERDYWKELALRYNRDLSPDSYVAQGEVK